MKTFAIVLLALLLLGLLKVGVRLAWDHDQLMLRLVVGPFRIALPKAKAHKRLKQPAPVKKEAEPPKTVKKKSTGKLWLRALADHWQDVAALIGKSLRTPTLDKVVLHLTVGGEDAAACALNYGRVCAAASCALPVLENTFRIRQRDIQMQWNYELDKLDCFFQTELTVRIYEILVLAAAGLKLLFQLYREIKIKQKAGQAI